MLILGIEMSDATPIGLFRKTIHYSSYTMKTLITTFAILASFAFHLASAAPLNLDKKGLAIKGYDPVAYFTLQKATKGNSQFTFFKRRSPSRLQKEPHKIRSPIRRLLRLWRFYWKAYQN